MKRARGPGNEARPSICCSNNERLNVTYIVMTK